MSRRVDDPDDPNTEAILAYLQEVRLAINLLVRDMDEKAGNNPRRLPDTQTESLLSEEVAGHA